MQYHSSLSEPIFKIHAFSAVHSSKLHESALKDTKLEKTQITQISSDYVAQRVTN